MGGGLNLEGWEWGAGSAPPVSIVGLGGEGGQGLLYSGTGCSRRAKPLALKLLHGVTGQTHCMVQTLAEGHLVLSLFLVVIRDSGFYSQGTFITDKGCF